MIGLPRGTVRLAPYHSEWKTLFEKEAAFLRSLMGDAALAVEHVGSTAIEGMDAKPIIDLMIAVPDLGEAESWIPKLEAVAYEFRPETDIPDRLFFAKDARSWRTHHLSLTEPSSNHYSRTLLFRDYLRSNRDAFDEYRALKMELATRYESDRARYTDGKTAFVERVLAAALKERCPQI